ncbi:MAG TPA: 50S ribosomal protein L29 [Candidatus Goldiibacteriota bacterium]|nr:50S ribosomal protein L29 [Candidatus Goldiibacteriota bacterium]
MKPQEARDLNPEEIERKLKEVQDNLFKLKIKLSTKQLENTSQIKALRRDVALLKTVLKQKKGANKEAAVK